MESIILGIVASFGTEGVTWINKKLTGTAFQGDGAFILSAVVAFVISVVQTLVQGQFNPAQLATSFSLIWVSSQAFFHVVLQTLNADVSSTPSTQ